LVCIGLIKKSTTARKSFLVYLEMEDFLFYQNFFAGHGAVYFDPVGGNGAYKNYRGRDDEHGAVGANLGL